MDSKSDWFYIGEIKKTTLLQHMAQNGFNVLNEDFMVSPETKQESIGLHPQSFFCEANWVHNWFNRVIKLKQTANAKLDDVFVVDRSPYSACVYAKTNGHLLKPVIDQQVEDLKTVGIQIITVFLRVDKKTLWARITERLKVEPHRKLYNEDDKHWLNHVFSEYEKLSSCWDQEISNNEDLLVGTTINCSPSKEKLQKERVSKILDSFHGIISKCC